MTAPATTSVRRPKLAILVTHPIQYYAPVYRALTQRGVVDPIAIYLTDAGATAQMDPGFGRVVQWDVPLMDGYEYRVLKPGGTLASRGFWQRHSRKLTAALRDARPDWLLVYGYASRMNWFAAHWARRNGVKLVYTSDSNSRNPERMVPLKKFVVRRFFSYVDTFLAPSERNVEYLLRYRAPRHKIRRFPFAIDVARFTPPSSVEVSRRYDFIWSGKLIARKRAADFISALTLLASQSTRMITACIIGDGPCSEALQAQAAQLPSHLRLDFLGFVNQKRMPEVLQAAQVSVLSSEHEPYGLAATEAAASGLALVVEESVGCVGATVVAQPDINTLTYRVGDVQALAAAMGRLLGDTALLRRMQEASLTIAQEHDVACAAQVIEQIVGEWRNV